MISNKSFLVNKLYAHLSLLITLVCLLSVFLFKGQTRKVEKYYDPSEKKKLREVFYVLEHNQDITEGPYISYYYDGKIKSSGGYQNNSPVGEWKYYYENGQLKTIGYFLSKKNSQWKYFYEDGQLRMEGSIIEKNKEGLWKYYFENGKLKTKGEYKNGKKIGVWKYYLSLIHI